MCSTTYHSGVQNGSGHKLPKESELRANIFNHCKLGAGAKGGREHTHWTVNVLGDTAGTCTSK